MAQLTMEFEIDRLVAKGRGRLRRGSQIESPQARRVREALPPTDPHVKQIDDVVRLSGQNGAILERLRRGPATNAELAAFSLKYTSRISDLRQYGFQISAARDAGGVVRYTLKISGESESSVA